MAPKFSRITTYSLADGAQLFEEALDEEELEDLTWRSRGPSEHHQRLAARNRRSQQTRTLLLPDEAGPRRAASKPSPLTERQIADLAALLELFGAAHTTQVINDVFESVDRVFDAALQILCDMAATLEQKEQQEILLQAAQAGVGSGGPSASPAGGDAPSPTITPAGGPGPQGSQAPCCWWDLLHESEREAVLACLSARELARIAWTCRDFAVRVRGARDRTRSLVIPTGVTLSGIVGMVAGHPNARAISLVRWGAANLRDAEFSALITAIVQGSKSPRRAVPVEALSLRGWTAATDSQVLTLLDVCTDLRELDLTDCAAVTDSALGSISKYMRAANPPASLAAAPLGPAAGVTEGWPALGEGAKGSVPQRGVSQGSGQIGGDSWGRQGSLTRSIAALTPPLADTSSGSAARGPAPPRRGGHAARDSSEGSDEDLPARSPGFTIADVIASAAHVSGSSLRATPPSAGVRRLPLRSGGGATAGSQPDADESSDGEAGAQVHSMAPRWGPGAEASPTPPGATTATGWPTSNAGGDDDDDDDDDGVLLDEDIAAREARAAAAAVAAAAEAGRAGRVGGTPPPAPPRRPSTGSTPPLPLSSSAPRASLGRSILLGSSPVAASPVMGTSPPLGTSPSTWAGGGGGGSGSYSRGSFASLGRTMFSKYSGGGGGGGGGSSAGRMTSQGPTAGSPATSGGAAPATDGSRQGGGGVGRGLEVLVLAGCSRVSADGVRALLAAPLVKQCLQALDVSRCMRITRAALVLPPTSGLRVLKASGCQNLHEVVMQLPLHSPLQELWLNNCRHLSKVHIVAPRLALLHLGGCKALGTLHLRCPRLTQLLANLCLSLADVEPEEVALPNLEELNLFGCRHVTPAALAALTASTPALMALNLNGCNALGQLNFTGHDALRALDVSGCRALCTLSVASPLLASVIAKACHRLATLTLDSPRLAVLDVSNCSGLQSVSLPAVGPATAALQAEKELEDVLAVRPARTHPSQMAVITSAARATHSALSAAAVAAPSVRAVGCDSLPQLTHLAFKVLRAAGRLHVTSCPVPT